MNNKLETLINTNTGTIKDINLYSLYSNKTNNYYTFSNFVIGPSNQMAYYSAFAIATSSSNINFGCRTPLFIYGNVGLGKTHLLHAIWNYIDANLPSKKILYISIQDFMQHFIYALRNKTVSEFRNIFKKLDVLMVDDLQFISPNEAIQSEFFNLIDTLIENGSQLIICADKSPMHMNNIQEPIRSRLSWGLLVDIVQPDYELKLEILKLKLLESKQEVSMCVLEFLASNINSSIRELEGALNKILAYQNLHKHPVNLKNVRNVIKDLIDQDDKDTGIENIINHIAISYDVSVKDLTSSIKAPKFCRPRQIAIYIIKKVTKLSLLEIAKAFNKKDHTSVIHAIKTIEKLIEKDENIKKEIERTSQLFV